MLLAASVLALLWWHYSSRPVARALQTPFAPPSLAVQSGTLSHSVAPPSPDQHTEQPLEESSQATATATPKFTPPEPVQVVPLAAELNGISPQTALENMRTSVRQFGAMFGGNPVGNNLEITSALQGENPKHINFLKEDGNRVNGQG